jgi:hypothetical protein
VAKAEAIQVGGTIGVATVRVTTVRNGQERDCALCVVTLRAVDLPAAQHGGTGPTGRT